MIDPINPNIRSIIHILNNWNFTFDGSYVRANLEIHITKEELEQIKSDLDFQINTLKNNQSDVNYDEEIRKLTAAVADINFSINELEKSRV